MTLRNRLHHWRWRLDHQKARVQGTPPLALALGSLLARVKKYSTTGAGAAYTAGAGAMYSTSAGAAYTAGAGAMYSTSAGASYTAGAGVTYSSTGAGAAYTAGAGAKKTPSGETTGAGAMYSTTGAGGSVWFGLFERPIKLDKKNLEPKWPRRLLWLLWLWLLWTRVDEGHSEYPQMPTIQLCNVWQNTWESRLLASPPPPSPR